jgi:phytoene synthase
MKLHSGETRDALDVAYAHCAAVVRAKDPDRRLATLFAPKEKRKHLLALYAFNAEVARVREVVSDPLPGEVRLQWWKDTLDGEIRGDVGAHPIAAALIGTCNALALPRKPLTDLIEARIFDLYDDPMPSIAYLDGYCAETSSAVIRLAEMILAGGRPASEATPAAKAGIAYAVTGLLRSFPWHAARGQVFIPKDVMERHGLCREDVVRGRGGPGVAGALADLRSHARKALAETRAAVGEIGREGVPAFLPVAFVEPYLCAMERPGYDPFRSLVDVPRWRKVMILWRQARRAGVV